MTAYKNVRGNCVPQERNLALLLGLLIAVTALLIYANSLRNGFVWDDNVVIIANPASKGDALSLFRGIDTARSSELTPYYRPLTMLTFLIENRLHGLNPLPMHFINILLHAANAFLVYCLARSVIKDGYASLLAGLLFVVHPISTEAVNFLSGGRNTLLACFFALVAFLLHRRSIIKENISLAVAGAFFFLAGLFSKETGLMIIPFIAVQEIPSLRNFSRSGYRAVVRLAPYVICTAIYMLLRRSALDAAGVRIDILTGLGSRLLDNLYIIPRYILTITWPFSASPRYYLPEDLHVQALPLIGAWLGIAVVLGWLLTRGRSRASVFGLSWLVVFWLPASGIVPIPSAPMADRYFYIPAIGLWIIVADQLSRLFRSAGEVSRYVTVAAVIVLLVLMMMTIARNPDWKNDVALFSLYVKQNPDQAFGHHNLGCAYLDTMGDLDAAEREFEKALSLDPQFPRLRTQMGYIQLLRGDFRSAVRHYNEAIVQNPFDAEAHLNLGMALERLGMHDEAIDEYRRFLAVPGNELPESRSYARERIQNLSRLVRE